MPSLFDRATVFTDIHFGKKGDSEQHNQDCLEFVDWFVQKTIEAKADVMIFMGDWFENRTRTRHDTAHYSKRAIDLLTASRIPMIWMIGNHDLFYRDSRKIHALEYLDKYPTITIVNEITQIEDCLFCPWLVTDEYATVINAPKIKYIFGHFELPTFLFNQMIEMPDKGGLHADHFENAQMIFSGHFHKRQCKRNASGIPVWYIGNTFPHDFNDVHDNERGMMILDRDAEPRFETWPNQPTFHRLKVTELLELLENNVLHHRLGPKSVVELFNDASLDDDTIRELQRLIDPQVRDLRIKNTKIESLAESASDLDDHALYADVDEMVEDHLRKVDTQGRYDTDYLVSVFRGEV